MILKKQISENQFSIILLLLLYCLFFLGFIFDENSTGGAYQDYINQKKISKSFSDNFINSLFNYDKFSTRHSPIIPSFFGLLEKLNLKDDYIRLISLHLGLLLPVFFFKSLKIKFQKIKKFYLILITGLIFLSPTFRSLLIWPDSRIYGLTIFLISIYYYYKFQKEKKFIYSIYCTFFYALASYISLNFALFAIFFFVKFFQEYKFNFNKILKLFLLNLILSLPFFFYIFYLENIFFLKTAVPAAAGEFSKSEIFNFSNKILIISSIIFFYAIPFLLTGVYKIKWSNKFNIILALILLLFLQFNFSYSYEWTGGGIFFKISKLLFQNNYLFYFICFFSLVFLIEICKNNLNNTMIIFCLILSNPQITIYHKYYDPLMLLIFLLLFNFKIDSKKLFKLKNIIVFYIYFALFLIINILKTKIL